MKNQNYLQPERLKKLADWLDDLKIGLRIDILESTNNSYKEGNVIDVIPVFITPIKGLPKIFENEWGVNSIGEVVYLEDEKMTTVASVQKFFGLDVSTFFHILAPYAQSNNKFGGKLLKNNARAKDIAFNIHELVKINSTQMLLHPEIEIFISKN